MMGVLLALLPVMISSVTTSSSFAAQLLAPSAMNNSAQAVAPNVPTPMMPPNKPTELGSLGVSVSQATARWKIPDQSGGRAIEQWLIRACPKVDGNPNAACQQVQQLNGPGGQASGTYVQAQIPSRVMYKGVETPVNGAEICAANRGGTSCADRIALSFAASGAVPGPAPTQNQAGGSPSGTTPGAIGTRPAHGFGSALQTGGIPPGGPGAPRTANSGPARTGQTAGKAGVISASIASAKPPEPIVLTANALSLKVTAQPTEQDIRVDAGQLLLKVAAAAAPSDIVVTASSLRLSVKQQSASSRQSAISIAGLSKNSVAVDAPSLRIKVTDQPPVQPIVVNTPALTLKTEMIPPPAPISVNTATLKLTITNPRQDIQVIP